MNRTSSPWLITGGAGYIGAHIVNAMQAQGRPVIIYDDLSTGLESRAQGAPFVKGSVLDQALLERTLRELKIAGVVHIAAKKQVGESVERPLYYYEENVGGLRTLLAAMQAVGVGQIVVSSSAAVYGTPEGTIVNEQSPTRPENPYGETKLIGEWLLADMARATGLKYVALRYFNVAGAATPELGDPGVFNLVPLVFQAMSRGERPKVFGNDYSTPDGTCIRDYVHVADIADAHLAAIDYLTARDDCREIYNAGTGKGASVLEVIAMIERVSGQKIIPEITARRPGDPAQYVGAVEKIARDLKWHAKYDLEPIVTSSWGAWQQKFGVQLIP